MRLTVYLAGQIHDDWRDRLRTEAKQRDLDVEFVGPQDEHDLSDGIGEQILGEQESARWKDEVASQVNNLRTRILMSRSDAVVAQFGEKFRQWNAAMDAGIAIALGKPLIIVRDPSLHHALKEVSQRAQMTVDRPEQVLDALEYVLR
ncbi:MAG: YtoQ family protein [Planctomycetota bacterium]|nr:YtoQ family protein [Planctomycetota bacterium]